MILPETQNIVTDVVSANGPTPSDTEELAVLRKVTARNMRLLKAQIVPLIDAALRSVPKAPDQEIAGHRSRWTATALRLIDETAIAAVAGANGGPLGPVDLGALMRQAAEWHGNRIGPFVMEKMPVLMGRTELLRVLIGEVMTGIAWLAVHGAPNGLRMGWMTEPGGAGIAWFQDSEMVEPEAKSFDFSASVPADRCWSICETILSRMGGAFSHTQSGQGRLRVALRFPEGMVMEATDIATTPSS